MPFFLKRGGNNVPLEVQRWQYFLLKQNIPQVGRIDGGFGLKTENATKVFQVQHSITATGEFDAATRDAARTLGYTVVADNYYDNKRGAAFPPKPTNLSSPDNESRNEALGCFNFKQLPLANRSDKDEVVILGSCDGAADDWRRTNIIEVAIPQLKFANGSTPTVTCHRLVAPHIQKLFAKWEEMDLLHLVRDFDGTFSPRYKRGQSPSDAGHGVKQSADVDALSNHSFGSAMDINADDNPFDTQPALCPMRGCVRELVAPANEVGFFWGGHFSAPKDGMHFEFAAFDQLAATS
jgi:D-alanyl-D-alanine carboxypeptidase-like protein/putative peptidoglycan binding protein